jgi:hypothetical protein
LNVLKPEISIDDGLVENVLRELEDEFVKKVYSKDIVDCACASTVINQVNTRKEKEKIKKDIAKAFVVSSWTQRIYFVVRSAIMTILGAIITLAVFWQLGTINVTEDFILGISTYVICLGLSRLFDTKMVNISKNILEYLGEHTKLREFIVKNL